MRRTRRQNGLQASGAPAILMLTTLAAVSLALTACDPPHPRAKAPLRAIASLDCPDSQGELNRKSVAADGKSCVYATDAGDEVTLQLVALDGKDSRVVLSPIEAQLQAELPAAMVAATKTPGAPEKDRVDINLPGLHIHSSGDGHADVDTVGVHVQAHDGGGKGADQAVVQVGGGKGADGVTVNANDSGAQVRVDERGGGIRASYILASETAGPHGYKAVGYEARGPQAGPVAVAVVLAKSDEHDDLRHDVRELLRRNVGG